MARVEGVQAVVAALQARLRQGYGGRPQVTVGYTATYAVYVHENLEATHPVGQAKFLEQPARTMGRELARIVFTSLRRGLSLGQSLLLAGLRLQRESQLLVPVDTGALKNSAFTRLEY